MWVCLLATGGPLTYAIYRFIAASHTPEGGFEGMAILFTLLKWGVVLLFPLIGFMHALAWRRALQDRLEELDNGGRTMSPNAEDSIQPERRQG